MLKIEINPIYERLLVSLADLNRMKDITDEVYKSEWNRILHLKEKLSLDDLVTSEASIFANPITGGFEKYAFRYTNVGELEKLTREHQNTHYCWLLVTAYEEFEGFIKNSYKHSSNKTSRTLMPMLTHFYDNYQNVNRYENRNCYKINLRIAIVLIEKLRHSIVHNQGKISSIAEFTENVLADSGINGNKQLHIDFIGQFISYDKIWLISDSHLAVVPNIFRDLVSFLIAYAYLVNESAS